MNMKKNITKSKVFTSEIVIGGNEYIGFGIPTLIVYNIQPSNIFPILNDEFSLNDSRPTTLEILDNHLNRYKNVWQALS
jgi:hypothetical protein